MPRINTQDEFFEHIKPGDEFITMLSLYAKPTRLVRYRFDGELPLVESMPAHRCIAYTADYLPNAAFVEDLINRWHGVWTVDMKSEATEYFRARMAAYETDPELMAEHTRAKGMWHHRIVGV